MKRCIEISKGSYYRCCSIIVVTCVAIILNDTMLRYAAKRNPGTRVNYILNAKPRSDQVAILGSSMIANAVSASQLSDEIGGDVIQLAVGGQGLQEQALVWELYLSRHRVKLLVLELHEGSLRVDTLPMPLRVDRYAAHLDNALIRRHLRDYSGIAKVMLWRCVPMYAFAEFSSRIGWQDWVGLMKNEPFDPHAPSLYATTHASRETLAKGRRGQETKSITAIDAAAVAALRSILDSAKRSNVRVVLVTPPMFEGEIAIQTEDQGGNVLQSEVQSLERIQFSVASQKDPAIFDDARHASQQGSVQFTKELSAALLELLRY